MCVSTRRAVTALLFACGYSVVGLWSGGADAQNLTVISGNSASGEIFQTAVDPDTPVEPIVVLNSAADQRDRVSPRSFVLFPSLTLGIDEETKSVELLVADTLDDSIWRYRPPLNPGGFWTADPTPVWADALGPVGPDGMSFGPGYVSVLSSTSNVTPGVYVLPVLPPSGGPGSDTSFGAPLLVDNLFTGLNVQTVEESLAAPINLGPVSFGDLLVAVSDRPMILRYAGEDLAAVLAGGGPISPTVLLDETILGPDAISGMAFWPVDNSLLVAQSGGSVLWFDYDEILGDWVPHDPPLFTSGQGQGKFRIRADYFSGEPLVIMANNRGELLVYRPPAGGINDPVKRITDGVQSPHGLVVTNLAAASADCLNPDIECDLLGAGEFPVFRSYYFADEVPADFPGSLTERSCRVPVDTRLLNDGVCTAGETLVLGDVCPAFATDVDVVIPPEICGVIDFGADGMFDGQGVELAPNDPNKDTHYGFAVVEAALSSFVQATDGVFAQLFPAGLLGPDVDLPCRTKEAIGWAAIPGEETPLAAGFTAIDIIAGCNSPGKTFGRSLSFWFLGSTNLPDLGDPLIDPVKKEAVWPVWRQSLVDKFSLVAAELVQARADLPGLSRAGARSFDDIQSCVARAEREATRGQRRALTTAAIAIADCDRLVVALETRFGFAQTPRNSYGAIRMLLANLYFVIQHRILDLPYDQTAFSGFYAPQPE